MTARRIIVADDHPLLRTAVSAALARIWKGYDIVEVPSAGAARTAYEDGGAELLVLDLHMEDSDGLTALLDFRTDFPELPVIVLSASEEPRIWKASRELGASAFIPKSSDMSVMQHAFAEVQMGELWFPESTDSAPSDPDLENLARLTPAQRRILAHISKGSLNKQIAHEMGISEATVKAHVTAIFRRLGVINRTQAVLIASKLEVPLSTDGQPAKSGEVA